jgi:signal peptidase I
VQVQSERFLTVSAKAMMQESAQDPKLEMVAEVLHGGANVSLELHGASMLPALWPGDVLTVRPIADDELVIGDLVFVFRGGRSFVHRLIRRLKLGGCPCWITRGDAVRHEDTPLSTSQVLGRVARIRRGSRDLAPSRKLSRTQRAFAWLLWHSARINGIILRIHVFRLNLAQVGFAKALRNLFEPTRENFSFPSSRTSHS